MHTFLKKSSSYLVDLLLHPFLDFLLLDSLEFVLEAVSKSFSGMTPLDDHLRGAQSKGIFHEGNVSQGCPVVAL
jgi:hypothetical protein